MAYPIVEAKANKSFPDVPASTPVFFIQIIVRIIFAGEDQQKRIKQK